MKAGVWRDMQERDALRDSIRSLGALTAEQERVLLSAARQMIRDGVSPFTTLDLLKQIYDVLQT